MTTATQRNLRYLCRKGIENARDINSSETAGIKPINSTMIHGIYVLTISL